ncbi:hypothetical protein JQM64_08775 [Fournierella massiliensis]|nr:hypothetical protein [Fournierella massiliensis]MCF2557605.1 hypothetical protein [Fournierella massiliensis]
MAYAIPAAREKSVFLADTFRGVDYTNEAGNVEVDKSPYAPNMIRDVPGKVRKCMGWYIYDELDGPINGRHKLITDSFSLIHAGTKLYKYEPATESRAAQKTMLYDGLADNRSHSWQLGGKLVIQDGKQLLIWDGDSVKPASEDAYIPTLTIGKPPAGGGQGYEAINLLQPKYTETFLSDGESKEYHMSLAPIDAESTVEAWTKNAQGAWESVTAFSVDYDTAVITFNTAPGKPPVTGEDNVKITVQHTVEGYADRINHCTIGILYGVNGVPDRLFLSGNPDQTLLNYDWWSGQNDPTYWPDTGYGTIGGAKSAVIGYCLVGNYLAAFKDNRDPERSVVLRTGEIVEKEAAFPVYNTLQGPGAIASDSFGYLGNEPLFLTSIGVYAVTTSDVTGDRYQQNRSYYIDAVLKEQDGLEKAFAHTYNDMYWLCLNGQAFILDGLQSMTERNQPYATRQYACFNRLNLPAHIMWDENNVLYFGTTDGKLCAFYTNKKSTLSFNDGKDIRQADSFGIAIEAAWETPDLTGTRFYKNKNFRYLAIQQQAAVYTGVKMYGMRQGLWKLLRDEKYAARYLFFPELVFSKFTFSSDTTNKTLHTKTKLKKMDKTRFRFVNDRYNEPFGLMSWAVEYVQSGNYKG